MEIGFGKILLLLAVIVLVFGTSKLPKVGEDLGRGIRNFRKAMKEGESDQPGEAPGGKPDSLEHRES